MLVKNRDVIKFFLEYLKKHSYFKVSTVNKMFKEQFLNTRKNKFTLKELEIFERPVGKIIGQFLGVAIRKGIIEPNSKNKTRRITPKLIKYITNELSVSKHYAM